MSEVLPHNPDHSDKPLVTPYNLQDFPAYKEALLDVASEPGTTQDVGQTFDVRNKDELNILTDPEFSKELSAEEHEKLFNELYPSLGLVYKHDELLRGSSEAALTSTIRRAEVLRIEHEQTNNPQYYRNIWATRADAEDYPNTPLAEIYRHNHEKLYHAQSELLKPNATLSTSCEWYLQLGSLNRMEGGEAALVHAATLAKDRRSGVRYSSDEQSLYAGCMLIDASLVNDRSEEASVDRQLQYEAQAREHLVPLAKNTSSREGRAARIHLNDLAMRDAGRLLVEGRANTNDEQVDMALKLAADAQEELGRLIIDTENALTQASTKNDTKEHGNLKGELVEQTILWLLREHFSNNANPQFDHITIHQAFPRHDWPQDGLMPGGQLRQSYDIEIVMKGKRPDGIIGTAIEPLQAKSSQFGKKNGYSPEIIMMADDRHDVKFIIQAIRCTYQGVDNGKQRVAELANAMNNGLRTKIQEKRAAMAAARS